MYEHDERVVMTLDAGGTNFIFSAMRGGAEIVEPVHMKAVADNLKGCLDTLVSGFTKVRQMLDVEPVAISFAFPGPADYRHGVIGRLPNFPAFSGGGVALGPYLEDIFSIPVYINNDGNLYAFGEALTGFLPGINAELASRGSSRVYRNLIGITFGTGPLQYRHRLPRHSHTRPPHRARLPLRHSPRHLQRRSIPLLDSQR